MKRAICIACMVIVTGWSVSSVFAASARCRVVKVEGAQLILDCGSKASKFEEGSKIKIKSTPKAAIEGC